MGQIQFSAAVDIRIGRGSQLHRQQRHRQARTAQRPVFGSGEDRNSRTMQLERWGHSVGRRRAPGGELGQDPLRTVRPVGGMSSDVISLVLCRVFTVRLSNVITRVLRLRPRGGDVLSTAGQALIGLSGALAEVVTASWRRRRRWLSPPPRHFTSRGRVATAPSGRRRYPDDVGVASIYEAYCWDPVAGGFMT